MSAKQVSSGYILWKTGPEPVRHSHRERARLLTAAPPGLPKLIGGKFHQAGEYAAVGSMGENRLPQPVPIPKKFPGIVWKNQAAQAVPAPERFPGIVWKSSGCPGGACSEETAGAGQPGGISPEASVWGQQPADARTEKHPEGHRAFRVFCYVGEITSSGRFRTTAGSPSGGAAGAEACPTGTAHGFRP